MVWFITGVGAGNSPMIALRGDFVGVGSGVEFFTGSGRVALGAPQLLFISCESMLCKSHNTPLSRSVYIYSCLVHLAYVSNKNASSSHSILCGQMGLSREGGRVKQYAARGPAGGGVPQCDNRVHRVITQTPVRELAVEGMTNAGVRSS